MGLSQVSGLILAIVAIVLGYWALRANRKIEEQKLIFERKKFEAEEQDRKELVRFREQEYKRFSKPAMEFAEEVARRLADDPHWAGRALEASKILPYRDTLFGERSQHFKKEKEELASRFTPYLLKRCREYIDNGCKHVYLLIDSGTTLFPFFSIIGQETSKAAQRGETWVDNFHLATNNLPGIEQLMQTGRRTQYGRYSKLAIEDCQLLPGVPIPVFAAVASEETNEAIRNLKKKATDSGFETVFIVLVVGNWVRIRSSQPRCPVPMARGREHLMVKQTLVEAGDEIFVVSPLGKIFVNQTNDAVNLALGFSREVQDLENLAYDEVKISNDLAHFVKLVSTTREEGNILYRHSNSVEDAFGDYYANAIDENFFAKQAFETLPHLLFPFTKLPTSPDEQFETEFPHYHTRTKPELLRMFSTQIPGFLRTMCDSGTS